MTDQKAAYEPFPPGANNPNEPGGRCDSVLIVSTAGYVRTVTRYVRCRLLAGHVGKHFASWGGSQAWRQAEWHTIDLNVTTVKEVPTRRRIW